MKNRSMVFAALGSMILCVALLIIMLTGDRSPFNGSGGSAKERTAESQELEQDVRAILKLVVVQAAYEEYFREKDANVIPSLLGKLGFKKKALLRVRGNVTVGYRFDEDAIITDPSRRTITLRAPSDPEIIAIEHDVDYLDVEQGLFSKFKKDDLTAINLKGKQRIREKATHSDIFARARAERDEVVAVVGRFVASGGWTLVVDSTMAPVYPVAEK